jgi:hypothetical protein
MYGVLPIRAPPKSRAVRLPQGVRERNTQSEQFSTAVPSNRTRCCSAAHLGLGPIPDEPPTLICINTERAVFSQFSAFNGAPGVNRSRSRCQQDESSSRPFLPPREALASTRYRV